MRNFSKRFVNIDGFGAAMARRWGIFHDMENGHRYVETFIVASLGRTSPATRTIHDGGSRDRGASAAMCHIRAESPAPSFGRVGRVLFH